eukprot:12150074-Ditylum_brightwellii.AAC.1
MPRSCGKGKASSKKKQKLLPVGIYDEASAIDSNSGHIDLSVLSSHSDVFEHEEMKKVPFDSTDNTCYISKNPKLETESYHELSKASHRAVQH